MLTSFYFLLFFILSLVIIYSITRNKKINLDFPKIVMAFGFKVLMGCIYGYIFQRYYGGDDTWMLHQGSIQEYEKLMHTPGRFFADLDPTASFRRNNGLATGWYYLLSDLEFWIITKPLAVFNMFSRGNYYINVVFFNLLTFWGQYLIYKLFAANFPQRKTFIFFLTFLLPTISFWLSGIRPDAWVMVSIGLALYYFHAWVNSNKIGHFVLFATGIAGLIIFRSPMLLILAPGIIAWFIAVKTQRSPLPVFAIAYGLSIVLFFASIYVSPRVNMLTYVVHRQQEFLQLKGNTVYQLNELEPAPGSFLKTLPQAFVNTFLRPTLWDAKGALQWMEAIATTITWLLLVVAILAPAGSNPVWTRSPITWLSIFFGVALYLFIGYTVPFPGAIARYKIIPELLLLLAICLRPSTNKIKN